jgi:predicted amidohydrolase
MRAGYLQFQPRFGEPEVNRQRMAETLTAVQADLLVLPELSNTGYNFNAISELSAWAESAEMGDTLQLWRDMARKRRMTLVGGFAERDGNQFYNSAAVALPDGSVAVYRKTHLFHKEPEFFSPGDAPPLVVDAAGARVGVMICFDWAFPEVARSLALRGAEVICHPSNIVTPFPQRTMVIRGVENRVFTITANRIGEERGAAGQLRFSGQSQVTTPDGAVLAASDEYTAEVRTVDIDVARARDKRLAGFTDLFKARRPELYGDIVERH